MHALVTGATGFVGGRLAPALLDAGHDVTALARDAAQYDPGGAGDDVRVVEADLPDPGSLAGAFEGVDLVTDIPNDVARPLIPGLKNPVIARDGSVEGHVDVGATPFDEAVIRALTEGGHHVARADP